MSICVRIVALRSVMVPSEVNYHARDTVETSVRQRPKDTNCPYLPRLYYYERLRPSNVMVL